MPTKEQVERMFRPTPVAVDLDEVKTGELALPSLAHPHVHLDKPYLLSHADTSHLQPRTGNFEEALSLTAQAKSLYTKKALLERGALLLAESSRAGVTHIRGFCEVDTTADLKCIEAGLTLKEAWHECMHLQIAAFAQDPLFSTKEGGSGLGDEEVPRDYIEDGNRNLKLLEQALKDGVEVIATTPYVEASIKASKRNIEWAISMAIERNLHLDFHLDYNLDSQQEPLVWHVLKELKNQQWKERQKNNRTVCLGHCTRLTLFSAQEWEQLVEQIGDLPVYFISLPTSDLFMQGRPKTVESATETAAISHNRPRSTLHIPSLLKAGFNGAIGINNIGNAFTPFGSADPLHLAKWCVGIYQLGTAEGARTLYECISWRAKEAMGILSSKSNAASTEAGEGLRHQEEASLIIFGSQDEKKKFVHQRNSVEEVIWNPPSEYERTVLYKGKHVVV